MASPLLHLALVVMGLREDWGGPGPKQQFLLLVTTVKAPCSGFDVVWYALRLRREPGAWMPLNLWGPCASSYS